MLKTHGVTSLFDGRDFRLLKQQALLFDKLYLRELTSDEDTLEAYPQHLKGDVEFLQESGVIAGPAERPDWPVPVTKNDRIRGPIEVLTTPTVKHGKSSVRSLISEEPTTSWSGHGLDGLRLISQLSTSPFAVGSFLRRSPHQTGSGAKPAATKC